MSKFQGTSSNWLEEVTKHEICISTLGGLLFYDLFWPGFPSPPRNNASNTVIYIFKAFYFWDSNRSFTETINKPAGRLVSDAAEWVSPHAARSTDPHSLLQCRDRFIQIVLRQLRHVPTLHLLFTDLFTFLRYALQNYNRDIHVNLIYVY